MHGSVKYVRLVLFSLIMLGVWLPAAAQDTARAEVSGGYNFIRVFDPSDEGEDTNFPGGWYADVAGNVNDFLAIVGQVNGNYKTEEEFGLSADTKVHGFLGGARLSRSVQLGSRANQRAVPFGQVLVGGTNLKFSSDDFDFDESDTFFTLQLGGGVNLMVNERVGVRIGADYLRLFEKEDSDIELGDDTDVFRFYAGIVLPFGTR